MHIINLSPSVPLEGDIPQRVWTGKDVSYKHLRVFSCRALVHIHPNLVFPYPSARTHEGDTKEVDDHDDDNNDEDGDDPPEQPPIPTESKLRRSTRVLDRDNLHRHIPLVIMYFLLMGEG